MFTILVEPKWVLEFFFYETSIRIVFHWTESIIEHFGISANELQSHLQTLQTRLQTQILSINSFFKSQFVNFLFFG